MGLFDKKYCDICGKEIKFLGNRKLDDGNMCKDCAAKLSPWFSGRRRTSLKDIKEQLAYREQNEKELANFKPTKIIGNGWKIYVDETKKAFIASRSSDWRKTNPDIISLADVRDIKITVDEDKDEIYDKDSEGKSVSFDPPRYEYEYSFKVHIDVNHKFFDDLDFELTDSLHRPDSPDSPVYKEYVQMAEEIMELIGNRKFTDPSGKFEHADASDEWFCPKCGTRNNDNFCTKCGYKRPVTFTPFYCSKCGEKIEKADTKFCPKCGNKLQ